MTGLVQWDLAAGLAGGLVVLVALLAVVVYLPQLAVDAHGLNRSDWLTHVEDLRATILQGLGGLALLGTLYFSARTLRLGRRGQLSERFTKAVEQLGQLGPEPEKLAVRLGGIYALEQIAQDSEELHWPVMEVLTAFVRSLPSGEQTPRVRPWLDQEPWHERDRTPARAEVQAILTVLGRRSDKRRRWERENQRALNLRFADLAGVHVREGHFEDALFTGARLDGAHLGGAHLERAYLAGACLRKAYLRGAHLQGAYLRDAHLEHADLRDARLAGADIAQARLQGTTFTGATIAREQIQHAEVDGSTVLPSDLQVAVPLPTCERQTDR
jgi:pentapeptide repeat protein